mgnify:CR=1 FL=1
MVGTLVGNADGVLEGIPVGTGEGTCVAPTAVGLRVEAGDNVGCLELDGDTVGMNVGRADGL